MRDTQARQVTVAGGGTLVTNAMIQKLPFHIQKLKFSSDFRILPLKGYELVLGVSWLKEHNPTTFDWIQRTLSLTKEGVEHTLPDYVTAHKQNTITAKKCAKLLNKGLSGYMIQLCAVASLVTGLEEVSTQLPDQIVKILQDYEDIFQKPAGLPPQRECDHRILLKEGSTPPNIRPYRMPHKQKNVVEAIVQELLQNKEIRNSTSPYSSPTLAVIKRDKT
jgi:hypothetical protein